ncbi:MAG: hypothetical protein IPM47_16835 [Sphingobacteriales bacterium]|nr:MAG: hypothetical protein IPM47_16835 [Sphingobacteriales bacterium]
MKLVQNNPYRKVGLLVGATAREQTRQINRLKKFLAAEHEPEDDFSFPILGNLHRTVDSVSEAASKLHFDSDKISAALFWFFKGNDITDEPAFDALKDSDSKRAIEFWQKVISSGNVTSKNGSAFHNLSTLLLCNSINGTSVNQPLFEEALTLKLKFLESEFVTDLQTKATDQTYKTTKKEIQLLFLNALKSELETHGSKTFFKLIEILTKQTFSAKEDFLKGFVQKLIEQIQKKIEATQNKRTANKVAAAEAGEELYNSAVSELTQLKNTLGTTDLRYVSIADKTANEILQCSIDYFNVSQEKESSNYFEFSMQLAKYAETLAVGILIKDRVKDSINTLAEIKDRELSQAIDLLLSIKNAYETNKAKITAEVKEQEKTLKWGESINWDLVNKMIENSIDWEKVIELIKKAIPPHNVEKIKNINDKKRLNEYRSLVDFIMGKLNSSQKTIVNYLIFKTPKIKEPSKENEKLTFEENFEEPLPIAEIFSITSSKVLNTDVKYNLLQNTIPFYHSQVRFISLQLEVEVFKSLNLTLLTKYFKPNGKLDSNPDYSPKKFTNKTEILIDENTKQIWLTAWGNNKKCVFEIGKHKIEVWFENKIIYETSFQIERFTPKERLQAQLRYAETRLMTIRNTTYFEHEIRSEYYKMDRICEWQFLRSQEERNREIRNQQEVIDKLERKSENKKKQKILEQQAIITELKNKIKNAKF